MHVTSHSILTRLTGRSIGCYSTSASASASAYNFKQKHSSASKQKSSKPPSLWTVQRSFNQPPTAAGSNLTKSGQKALAHFDQIYGSEFGPDIWPSCRLALLSPPKHAAVLNRFYPDQAKAESRLLNSGAEDLTPSWRLRLQQELQQQPLAQESADVNERNNQAESPRELKLLSYDRFEASASAAVGAATKTSSNSRANLNEFLPATEFITEMDPRGRASLSAGESLARLILDDDAASQPIDPADPDLWLPCDLTLAPNFRIFGQQVESVRPPEGKGSRWFPRPQPDPATGLCPYLPMDLGSVAAALALCPTDGDSILDLCAAPGAKAYCLLQQALPSKMLCLDNSSARSGRLARLLSSHVPALVLASSSVKQLYANALDPGSHPINEFDRVLVDPTCSGDRHSLNDPEADLFSAKRSKERINLPTRQLQLLLTGAAACRPGGSLVYSTCTMSPAQNEAVVLAAMAKLRSHFRLIDLRPMAGLLTEVGCRVQQRPAGLLILPYLLANYGPTYVCKLRRLD